MALTRSQTQTNVAPKKRRFSLTPYLFILPHLVFFAAFLGWPLFYGIYISLFNFDFTLPSYRPFIGLQNYQNLFNPLSLQYRDFWDALKNTGIFMLWSVPPLVILALLLAVLLNGNYRGRNFFRGIYFAPWSLSAVVASLLGWWMFQDQGGIVNIFVRSLGLSNVPWLGALPWAWIAITVVTLWWTVGFNTIIFLAALQDIPNSLYEAAAIDGASSAQQFFNVTVPPAALGHNLYSYDYLDRFGKPVRTTLRHDAGADRQAVPNRSSCESIPKVSALTGWEARQRCRSL